MSAIYATEAASEAAIENETGLECLGRIGVESVHLVRTYPNDGTGSRMTEP
jgi:hypothetical protein